MTIKHSHAGGLYSAEGLSTSVSAGEDSKRFLRRRAPVNNLTSQGVKGHGFCIHWKILKALLGLHGACILLFLAQTRIAIISSRHKFTHR